MDFDDIYRFFVVFSLISVALFATWFGYFRVKQHYMELALEQDHVRYHLEHKDAFHTYCSRCGKAGYNKSDINVTLSENDHDATNE